MSREDEVIENPISDICNKIALVLMYVKGEHKKHIPVAQFIMVVRYMKMMDMEKAVAKKLLDDSFEQYWEIPF